MDQLLESLRKAREHITVQKRPWIDALFAEAIGRIEELELRLEIAAKALVERVIPQAESLVARVRATGELEEQRDALWQLLDNIDTLDDSCRENDRAFRDFSRKHLRARFEIYNPEEGK